MNKKLLMGITTALILTGGYYASAAGIKIETTTFKPGTPYWEEYVGSPAGVTKTTTGTVSSQTITKTSQTNTQPITKTGVVPVTQTSTQSTKGTPPVNATVASGYIVPNVTLQSLGTAIVRQYGLPNGWQEEYFDDLCFPVKTSWTLVQDSPGEAIYQGAHGGTRALVTPGTVYGPQWDYDQTHLKQYVRNEYGAVNFLPGTYDGPPHEQWSFTSSPNSFNYEQIEFTVPSTGQTGFVAMTNYGVFSAIYSGNVPEALLSLSGGSALSVNV